MTGSIVICHKDDHERKRLGAIADRALRDSGVRDRLVRCRAIGDIRDLESGSRDRPLVVFHLNNDQERPVFLRRCRAAGLPVLLVTSGTESTGRIEVEGGNYPILGTIHDRADELRQLILLMNREKASLESCWAMLPTLRRNRLRGVLDALAAADLFTQSCLRAGGRADREIFDSARAATADPDPFTRDCDDFLDSLVAGGDASGLPAHSRSGSAMAKVWARLKSGRNESTGRGDWSGELSRARADYRATCRVLASAWSGKPVIMTEEADAVLQTRLQDLEDLRVAVNHDQLRNAFLERMGSAQSHGEALSPMRLQMAEEAWAFLVQPSAATQASHVSVAQAIANWPQVLTHVREFLMDAPSESGLVPLPAWSEAQAELMNPEDGALAILDEFVGDFQDLAVANATVRRARLMRFWKAADRVHGAFRGMHGRLGDYVALPASPEAR